MPAVADRQMAKKKAADKPSGSAREEQKTLKCSLSTYDLVRRVAGLRGMDIKDYVDEVLKPIAQKQLREVARQIMDEE